MLLAASPATASDSHPGLVRYRGSVEHIFFHPLMPAAAYTLHRGTQPEEFGKWNITVGEFRRILPQLYANDYVLVDLDSLVTRGPALKPAPLWVPRGKKPLVISIDDLNYLQYMIDNHLNSKLVLDDKGRIAAQRVTPAGRTVVSRSSEIVPILDRFVEQHPDFSLDGAKGTIGLTGSEGILGYRTSGHGPGVRRERRAVAPIVARLKDTGWNFASHTYAHPDLATSSLGRIEQDTAQWEKYVQPLLGSNTRILLYPFGSYVTPGSPGFRVLRRAGFRIFCGISPSTRFEVHRDYAVQDRVRVDGLGLTTQQWMTKRFFDAGKVLDPVR